MPGRDGVWASIDPAPSRQITEVQVDEYGLRLVLLPPSTAAGIGAVQLRMGKTIFGEVRFSLCAIDAGVCAGSLAVDSNAWLQLSSSE